MTQPADAPAPQPVTIPQPATLNPQVVHTAVAAIVNLHAGIINDYERNERMFKGRIAQLEQLAARLQSELKVCQNKLATTKPEEPPTQESGA